MRILALSDRVEEALLTEAGLARVREADVILSCGDLPYDYLEEIATLLRASFLYVLGNHDRPMLRESGKVTPEPEGGIRLRGRARAVPVRSGGVALVAGLEGTHRCSAEGGATTEWRMAGRVLRMLPKLLWNRLRYGRALDVLISHAPPAGIHEADDPCHRGFRIHRWLIRLARPRLALHGHIHPSYGVDLRPVAIGPTRIVNVYGAVLLEVDRVRH